MNGLGRMLVNDGSAVNILFGSTFDQMDVDFREPLCYLEKFMEFLVIDTRSAYHGVLGRPALKDLATYQQLVNCMLSEQNGNTMEVYVDDMLIKSMNAEDHIGHLRKMFKILYKYCMKLNSLKCAFEVVSRKFLGYMVNQRRIEANLEKIKMLIDMRSSSFSKDVQSLTGRLAALNRFISKTTDYCQPFF
ncbi:Disease resistance protein TIR-NBS-LRR class family [Abeliophyllum distichum]|uniref:Disease resistance protein TIR-NBS-LRR class family n=1 Tax=Abeliophyllum distichum TaxID=126358 RepID=A0ABD1US15_9LAMI